NARPRFAYRREHALGHEPGQPAVSAGQAGGLAGLFHHLGADPVAVCDGHGQPAADDHRPHHPAGGQLVSFLDNYYAPQRKLFAQPLTKLVPLLVVTILACGAIGYSGAMTPWLVLMLVPVLLLALFNALVTG